MIYKKRTFSVEYGVDKSHYNYNLVLTNDYSIKCTQKGNDMHAAIGSINWCNSPP